MFGSWLWYVLAAVPLVTAGAMLNPKGKAWVKRQHRRLWRRTVHVTKNAIGHKRDTPKRRAKAAKRAERKAQPWGLGFRRTRPDGDPRLTARLWCKARAHRPEHNLGKRAGDVAASWWERAQLWWLNREQRRREAQLTADQIARRDHARSQGLCGSTDTIDGTPCMNKREIGKDRCQLHPRRFARIKL